MSDFFEKNSQFDNLNDVRENQQRKAADLKELKRYERALSSDQGKLKTVRRMMLNHPTWLNSCLFHNGQWNALHVASAEEQLPKVMWLLAQEGIEVNAPDKHNFTALELAMARNADTKVAQALLKGGAYLEKINARSLRPAFKNLIEAEKIRRQPKELRSKSSKSEILRLKLYLHRVGAFKLLAVLIKNGIDNIKKFQSTNKAYLNSLGIKNAQIYKARLKNALASLLPALAFADAAKRKQSTMPSLTSSTGTNTEVPEKKEEVSKSNDADSNPPAQTNQSSAASASASPETNHFKGQTELKLFILSANLPLKFAALMFESGVRGVKQLRSIVGKNAELEALCSRINMHPGHVRLLKAAFGL